VAKKRKNERTLYCKTVNWRLRPPCLLLGTKIAGKLFFTAYSNDLIYKDIIFGLNCCEILMSETDKDVTFITIYDKGEVGSISKLKIIEILKKEGLI